MTKSSPISEPRPMVSVIVPCYNQARFLPEALASLQLQTLADWECIIVNDGSPDNTAAVAQEWVKKDSRIRYIEKTNGGLASARNSGLEAVRGQFVQFLDADDAVHPRKFELQVAEAARVAGLVVVYCNYYYSSEHDLEAVIAGERLPARLQVENPLLDLAIRWETKLSIPCHCFLFDARLFSEGKIRFDERLPNHEDLDCWMRIFACRPTIRYVDEKLANYRIHSESMCRNRARMRSGFLTVLRKQQRLLRKNHELVRALKAKRLEVKRVYKDCEPFAKTRRTFRRRRAQLRGVVVAVAKQLLPRKVWDKMREISRSVG